MEISDADLIARVLLSDDRNAFSTLVRRYQSMVRNMLRQLSKGDLDLADDLAQETFIKAFKAMAKFRGEAKFATWLYRIAYNVFVSHARSKKVFVPFDEQGADEASNMLEPLEQTTKAAAMVDLREDLNSAMQHLSNNERVAIEFCYQNGFSHSEAAEVLGQPVGTIKTHIARGKEKLRQHMGAWKESVCYE